MNNKDFFWMVGLLEGEGSFWVHPRSVTARLSTCMKDRDVIERLAMLLGTKCYGPYVNAKKPAHSAVYQIALDGKKAVEWMRKLQPFMSVRRTAQIEHVLEMWDSREFMSKPEALKIARKFRFATEEQRLAQRDQALKIGLGKEVRPN